jgi:hypothetical protein
MRTRSRRCSNSADRYFAAKVVVLGGGHGQPSGNVWCNGTLNSSAAASASCYTASSSCGIWLQFPSCSAASCALLLSAAISFVSVEQAWLNMAAELPSPSTTPPDLLFQTVATRTQEIWRESLSRVTVGPTATRELAVKLYTAVYHTLMAPSIFSEGQMYPPPASPQLPSSSSPSSSPTPPPVYRSFDGSVRPWPHTQPYLTDMSMYCTPLPFSPRRTVTLCSYGTLIVLSTPGSFFSNRKWLLPSSSPC